MRHMPINAFFPSSLRLPPFFVSLLNTFSSHRSAATVAPRGRTWMVLWSLVVAMLLAPTLGRMHQAVHAHGPALALVAEHLADANTPLATGPQVSEAAPHVATASSVPDWVHGLFSGHSTADCLSLDQAHHGMAGPPFVVQWASAELPAGQLVQDISTQRASAAPAFFNPRAPPPAWLG
jgi:hypothetical protein